LYQTIFVDGDDLAPVCVERAARGRVKSKRFGYNNFPRKNTARSTDDKALRVLENESIDNAIGRNKLMALKNILQALEMRYSTKKI
jgi:hypothetical protein